MLRLTDIRREKVDRPLGSQQDASQSLTSINPLNLEVFQNMGMCLFNLEPAKQLDQIALCTWKINFINGNCG